MDIRKVLPARRLRGDIEAPADKSIGHRVALVGAIAEGTTVATNFPQGADPQSTLRCLEGLGVEINRDDPGTVKIIGKGICGLDTPRANLDAGNSGTTVRLLSGILAGNPISSTVVGDESLSRRPMGRVVGPLEEFGARIETTEGHLPMTVHGGPIRAIDFPMSVASAQVKSAVLLAGLHAEGTTVVHEPVSTRDHTEIALAASGAALRVVEAPGHPRRIEVDGGQSLKARSVRIPGDMSSAAFLIAAGLLVPDSQLRVSGVGVNPTRSDFLALVEEIGGAVAVESMRAEDGEAVAEIVVASAPMRPINIVGEATAGLIDELPILAVLGVCGPGQVTIRGAGELRLKETDRIRALAVNLKAIGATVEEFEDGLRASCDGPIEGGTVSSFGDHRIAMAFAVAGLVSRSGVTVENSSCVDISFPGFFESLDGLTER